MDVLELRGPEFLKVYAAALAVAVVAGIWLRRVTRGAGAVVRGAWLGPHEIAYLTGGPRLAVNTAIAGLYRRECVRLTAGTRSLVAVRPPAQPADPLDDDVYCCVSSGGSWTVREVHRAVSADAAARRPVGLGLVLTPLQRVRVGLISVLPLVTVLLLGLAKVMLGLSRNRPVGFLGVFCFLTFAATAVLLASTPRRTRAGDALLASLKTDHAALRSTAMSRPNSLALGEFALAMGLFGPAVLEADDMGELRRAIVPPNASVGSSCGSGCGGGGGSWGSCCGGGGGGGSCGGGGGCGGCGGGGCGS